MTLTIAILYALTGYGTGIIISLYWAYKEMRSERES